MAFDLVMGTERALALQKSIQDELTARGYSPDADPVLAEFITIMLINNKTADQITAELQDLIGVNEYDASFTEWLFAEAAKQASSAEPALEEAPQPAQQPIAPQQTSEAPRRGPPPASRPLHQQAISQATASSSPQGQKRPARTPSPNAHANKSRRTELPTGPRAMQREGPSSQKSLLERVGGRPPRHNLHGRDEIQARIDAVTQQHSPQPSMDPMQMQMAMGMNGMPMGMMGNPGEMSAMAGMVNQMTLQDMMLNQMALMAQMATSMGLMNPQGLAGGNPAMMNGMNGAGQDGNGFQQQNGAHGHAQGRGGGPGRGRGRGRGGQQWSQTHGGEGVSTTASGPSTGASPIAPPSNTPVQPTPSPASQNSASTTAPPQVIAPSSTTPAAPARPGFVPPERPQSPTLCKFGLKCTNPLCRWSHPSPVATPESGVVLSNDPCEKGKDCKDKDCIKAHVSPAVVNTAQAYVPPPKPEPPVQQQQPQVPSQSTVPCRYGTHCTKVGSGLCPFSHPTPPPSNVNHFAQPCRFGAACTRASCPFTHPASRVLPSTFHRGLTPNAPVVNLRTPEAGSMGGPSPHKSVVFNKPALKPKEGEAAKGDGPAAKADGSNVVSSETKTVQAAA